jgi:hypothetical protein
MVLYASISQSGARRRAMRARYDGSSRAK